MQVVVGSAVRDRVGRDLHGARRWGHRRDERRVLASALHVAIYAAARPAPGTACARAASLGVARRRVACVLCAVGALDRRWTLWELDFDDGGDDGEETWRKAAGVLRPVRDGDGPRIDAGASNRRRDTAGTDRPCGTRRFGAALVAGDDRSADARRRRAASRSDGHRRAFSPCWRSSTCSGDRLAAAEARREPEERRRVAP